MIDPGDTLKRTCHGIANYESDFSHFPIEFGFQPGPLIIPWTTSDNHFTFTLFPFLPQLYFRVQTVDRGEPASAFSAAVPAADRRQRSTKMTRRQREDRDHGSIIRDSAAAAGKTIDLIIVGGGIYGVMLALEAGRRGKRALLLEKDDFGGATSLNHLRTVHGGLRYLQSLDLPRFFESVRERRWFLANFPALVQVLPCLMPLYGRGLKRPQHHARRPAAQRSAGLEPQPRRRPPRNACRREGWFGRASPAALSPRSTAPGLQAGALWYDAAMPEHQRLLMEILRWACAWAPPPSIMSRAESLLLHHGQVRGVLARDQPIGPAPGIPRSRGHQRRRPLVPAAGAEIRPGLSPAFPQAPAAVQYPVQKKGPERIRPGPGPRPSRPDHTYFVHNWKNRLLAGTGEIPVAATDGKSPRREPEDIAEFIADMNDAVPELILSEKDIEHVYAGILPATAPATWPGAK